MNPVLVGILMGSDSDLPVMREAAQVLSDLGIGVDMHVMSAHRTPDDAAEFARTAAERGLRVIIAGAGGAAHLPGVLAAYTTLPVIGVPIASGMMTLGGLDALLAIVQMPAGIPVATVAINGARNAGLLAAEILATADESLRERLTAQRKSMADSVRAKDKALQSQNGQNGETRAKA
jgi:5-(carboxyamino)imidazole ribonucleotide mutase